METKTQTPSFTVSLRGYDREEVDEYIDSLAEALGQLDEAKEQNRRLQTHITRLSSRIKDLEERITGDTPKTGSLLGERIAIMLRAAEETASDTIARAEAGAAQIIADANAKLAESEDSLRAAAARGEAQARAIEAAARSEAAEITAEAEARASARTRQIEQWAEEVVSRTRAEEARMLKEQQDRRNDAMEELQLLAEQREEAAATLAKLRDMLGEALTLVEGSPAEPAGEDTAQESERAAEACAESSQLELGDDTGEFERHSTLDDDGEFEAKLEAWVSEGRQSSPED
jgi:DivIVA domain-containing protein